MYVKIVGFKCHLDSTYNFDPSSMILLKGESGVGKSTILQAIYWALYGSMRNIYNNTGQIKKCSVTLKINQLIIYRQKRPELLQVTITNNDNNSEGTTYADAVAQKIIDQAFGSKELWKACSYVSQKERCSLLTGSSSERLALLNQLSFDQDNPKEYITIIDRQLKETNKQFVEAQASFRTELSLYTEELTNHPITISLNSTDIEQLKQDIINLEIEIDKLYQEVLVHERNMGSYGQIKLQIEQTKTKLSSITTIQYDKDQYDKDTDELNNNIRKLQNQVTLVTHYNNIRLQSERLQMEIANVNNGLNKITNDINQLVTSQETELKNLRQLGYNPDQPLTVTEQMVWQTTQQETQRHQYIAECQQLGCEYDQTRINDMIKRLQEEVIQVQTMNHNIQIYNQIKFLENKYNSLLIDTNNISQSYIDTLEKANSNLLVELAELRKGLELLQCPECSKPLRYINNQLVPVDHKPVDPSDIKQKEDEYRSNLNIITGIRNAIGIQTQIQSLRAQLTQDAKAIENYMGHPKNITSHPGIISRLSRIQLISPPNHSSDYLRSVLDYNRAILLINTKQQEKDSLVDRIEQLKSQLGSMQVPEAPSNDLNTLNAEINKYRSDLQLLQNKYNQNLQQINTQNQLITTLNNLTEQQKDMAKLLNPSAKTMYETTKTILEQTKTKYNEAIYTQSMITKQKALETKRQSVMNLNEDLVALGRLKQNAINTECKQLEDTVNTINNTLNDILPLFFTEPIEMSLQLYKMLKTKKKIKPGLNISIKHKGVEYDNINQLSGGEGDRVSLALVLSLNQISNSPLVMLDECISSLDGTLKEECIQAMKKMENRTIICVDHEGVEGYYDKTILVKH